MNNAWGTHICFKFLLVGRAAPFFVWDGPTPHTCLETSKIPLDVSRSKYASVLSPLPPNRYPYQCCLKTLCKLLQSLPNKVLCHIFFELIKKLVDDSSECGKMTGYKITLQSQVRILVWPTSESDMNSDLDTIRHHLLVNKPCIFFCYKNPLELQSMWWNWGLPIFVTYFL